MQSLAAVVAICALGRLGALAEIPTWDASCVGCPLNSLADHKVESAGGFLATTLTVDVITCVEIKFYGAFVLNHRVVLHAIDATPARWRGDAGSSPFD